MEGREQLEARLREAEAERREAISQKNQAKTERDRAEAENARLRAALEVLVQVQYDFPTDLTAASNGWRRAFRRAGAVLRGVSGEDGGKT